MLSKAGVLDQSKLAMEYKLATDEAWTPVAYLTVGENDTYSVRITGLDSCNKISIPFYL